MTSSPKPVPSPQRVFCRLAAAFGLLILLVTPPNQVPDEQAHYLRALQVAGVRLATAPVGSDNPSSLDGFFAAFPGGRQHNTRIPDPFAYYPHAVGRFRLRDGQEASGRYGPAPYPAPTYLPQAAGILLARVFTTSILITFYAARVVNLLCFVALVSLAIRITPVMKWLFVLLALTPMAVAQGASASADALTSGLSFLFCAQVFRLAFVPAERPTRGRLAGLAVTAAVLVLAKPGYQVLLFAVFLIPPGRVGSRRRYWSVCGVALLVAVAAVVGWATFVVRGFTALPAATGVDVTRQFEFVTDEPLTFALILANAAVDSDHFSRRTWQYVGVFGWLDTPLPVAVVCLHWAVLLLVAAGGGLPEGVRVARWQQGIAAGVACVFFVVVYTLMYLAWTPVREFNVYGVQGRYFIPFGPLMFLPLFGLCTRGAGSPEFGSRFVRKYSAALLAFVVLQLVDRHYEFR